MYFIDVIKANTAIGNLQKELTDTKADRDLQLSKLKEFEDKNKDYIESAQTAEQMKESHKKELDTLKAEYESKIADKDKELATIKEESAKTISTVKESVAEETIRIVASQGTNVVIDTMAESLPSDNYYAEQIAKDKTFFEKNKKEILKMAGIAPENWSKSAK